MIEQCAYVLVHGPRAGQRCVLHDGHAGEHRAINCNVRVGDRGIAKRRDDARRSLAGTCVECGGPCSDRAKRCRACHGPYAIRMMRAKAAR